MEDQADGGRKDDEGRDRPPATGDHYFNFSCYQVDDLILPREYSPSTAASSSAFSIYDRPLILAQGTSSPSQLIEVLGGSTISKLGSFELELEEDIFDPVYFEFSKFNRAFRNNVKIF
ncbi:hypothetical protein EVAR_65142_1 [Eumeta japonica]|uniref:Uncharacterized protein n=1 Tax=Eumeta variegata TaxID=151549 RepID=A0A4C1ZXW9_EUMVA|nr:hypothetical protein EVAR_65142_1 [Eumeta japonica]